MSGCHSIVRTHRKDRDRRSLAETRKPSGVLIGHTEGITYVSAKGDGRYVISNGKDQILRLWDLRMMRSNTDFEAVAHKHYGIPRFDYRCVCFLPIDITRLKIVAGEKAIPARRSSSTPLIVA